MNRSCPLLVLTSPRRAWALHNFVLTIPWDPYRWYVSKSSEISLLIVLASEMTHATLYTLANSLGILAMLTVVGYHFVAVNARHLAKNGESNSS